MEIVYIIVMGGLGAIILPFSLIITGILGGFVIAKVAQKAAPHISNGDVAAITRGWAISLALGGASAAIFFAYALASTLTWNYPKTGLFMTVGFAIVGLFAGLMGVRKMFRQIGSSAQHSVLRNRPHL
jgi:hypothetical protein